MSSSNSPSTSETEQINRQAYANQSDPILQSAIQIYRQLFSSNDPQNAQTELHAGIAPGRVNLIGEHTDYNDGYVMPFAIPHHTVTLGTVNASNSKEWRLVACSLSDGNRRVDTFTDQNFYTIPAATDKREWHDYVRGVCAQYRAAGVAVPYFTCVIIGNVPLGSGLSSSASLEVSVAMFLESVTGGKTDGVTIAQRCQQSEHQYLHTPCGIMDQFIAALGTPDNTMLLDCQSCTYQLIPFNAAANVSFLVINSSVKHSNSDGEYAKRRAQCQSAVSVLQHIDSNIKSLRNVKSIDVLEQGKGLMADVLYARARHVITEDQRTLNAATALRNNDFTTLGKLMIQSHVSLKNDYEVSCRELDTLVDIAISLPGVYGSRMTGGGFGGCTITLVDSARVESVKQQILEQYKEKTGKEGIPFITVPSAGATYLRVK